MTEFTWVCDGFDTRKQMHDRLAFIRETAEQAIEVCQQLHPDFVIAFVEKVD